MTAISVAVGQSLSVGRALTAGGVGGGLPAATRYVSQSATNGYAEGADSGDGTTKDAPWLTLTYAIANSVDGDVIYINDGTYAAATFYNIVDKGLTFVAQNRRAVTIRAAAAQSRNFNLTSSADRSWAFYRLVFDGQNNTDAAVSIGSSSLTSFLSVSLIDCAMIDHDQRIILSNSQKRLNLTVRNCDASGAWAGNNIIRGIAHEEGHFDINGLTINGTMSNTSTKVVIEVTSVTGNTTAAFRDVSGTVESTTTSGGMFGIRCINFDAPLISDCGLSISNPNGGASGANYIIYSDSLTLTANNAVVENSTGHNGCDGGYCILIGADGATNGDGNHNNGTIRNNNMTAKPDAATPIHGLMLGYGTGGTVYGNTVTGAGLAMIAKQHVGGEFYENTINECNSQAIRAKGATDTVFRDNTVNLSASYAGDCVVVDANDAPATDSTGIEITDNVFNIAAAPANIVLVAVDSDAAFAGNTYNITTALGADSWGYQGTAYQTLEAWKAVEPTALP